MTIVIEKFIHVARVRDNSKAVRAVLDQLLTGRLTRFDRGGQLGLNYRVSTAKYYFEDSDQNAMIPTSKTEVVAAALRRIGREVKVVIGDRFDPLDKRFERKLPQIEHLHPILRAHPLVGALNNNFKGRIEVRDLHDVASHIELIVRLHPQARIIVGVTRKKELAELYRLLRPKLNHLVAKSLKHWRWNCAQGCLLAATTFLPCTNAEDWDLVVYTDALEATSKHFSSLKEVRLRRFIGFVRFDAKISHRCELLLQHLFGPVIYRQGSISASPYVVALPVPAVEALPNDTKAHERKRRSIWHNLQRNQAIIAAAKDCQADLSAALSRRGFNCGQMTLKSDAQQTSKTVILVEVPAHGRALLELLPEWSLKSASSNGAGEETPITESVKGASGVIVTMACAAQTDVLLDADVIVRADGGRSQLQLPSDRSLDRQPLVIVDAVDTGDKHAAANSKARFEAYANCGWQIFTVECPSG